MSTVTQIVQIPDAASLPATPSRSATASTLKWLHNHSWGLFDQVLISATNFVTMVLTARALKPNSAEFGEFSLIYSALLFANVLQSTLITQPHNVLAATR